jgi:hypothetical protein
MAVSKRLYMSGIQVPCISCLDNPARWLVLNFPLCDDCANVPSSDSGSACNDDSLLKAGRDD